MSSEPNDSICWVHLSDFHFTTGKDYGRDEVLQALVADLEMFAGKRPAKRGAEPLHPDLLLITGDIAFSGKGEEYAVAREALETLCRAADVSPDRVFAVPGNHDGDRDADLGLMDTVVQKSDFER